MIGLKKQAHPPEKMGMADPSSSSLPLQFEKAEGAPAELTCAQCQQTVSGAYFTLNGQLLCADCRDRIENTLTASGRGRFVRAVLYGFGAAVAGAILYWGIPAATGYMFSLTALLVGYLVARGVRLGSGGQSGRRYQVLAVVLTYFSITTATTIPAFAIVYRASVQAYRAAVSSKKAASPASTSAPHGVRSIGYYFFLLFIFALASPFLGGFDPLGLFILAIGLYEAWKLTRRVPLQWEGPFTAPEPAS